MKREYIRKHKLKIESALLSVLLPPTGVSFYANFCFSVLMKFPSWHPLKIIVFDDLKVPGPPQIDPGHIWENSFFHVFGGPGSDF